MVLFKVADNHDAWEQGLPGLAQGGIEVVRVPGDHNSMLEDPHAIVEAWCNAVGIEFLPEALSWEPGARDEVSWWVWKY